MKIETQCLHEGYTPKNGEPRVVPIVQSTTYVYDSSREIAEVFDDPTKSLIYSRFENPTTDAVEKKIAALEGGAAALRKMAIKREMEKAKDNPEQMSKLKEMSNYLDLKKEE